MSRADTSQRSPELQTRAAVLNQLCWPWGFLTPDQPHKQWGPPKTSLKVEQGQQTIPLPAPQTKGTPKARRNSPDKLHRSGNAIQTPQTRPSVQREPPRPARTPRNQTCSPGETPRAQKTPHTHPQISCVG